MKYVVVGDFHGADLSNLEAALQEINPEVLIGLGDFDQTKTMHQWIDISKQFDTKTVPGNHDHAILNNIPIMSGTLNRQGKTSEELYEELMADSEARRFIDELVNSRDLSHTNEKVRIFLDEERFGETYKTLIIHGAYAGDMSSAPGLPPNLWTRLLKERDYRLNFDAMDKKCYKVMLRGHDHTPLYASKIQQSGDIRLQLPLRKFDLKKQDTHVINPGAFYDGFIAIIDTQATKKGIIGNKKANVPVLYYAKIQK